MKLKKLVALPLAICLALPTVTGALTLGSVALVASLTGCAGPAKRQDVRQDTRIENRADDRYDRRRH